jgi:hypothetical protein
MKPAKKVAARLAAFARRAGFARVLRWAAWLYMYHLLTPGVLLARGRRFLRDHSLLGFSHQTAASSRALHRKASSQRGSSLISQRSSSLSS